MKVCTVCGVEKPLDLFHNRKLGKLGKNASCKSCRADYHSKRWKELPEVRQRAKTAQIVNKGKAVYLGSFRCRHEAALAYNKASKELHKDFGRLNELHRD